jgi:hypothetical protein
MKTKCRLMVALSGSLLILASAAFAAPCAGPGAILRVRNTVSGNYEYVIFDYIRPPAATYSVTTVTPPFIGDGSGDNITISGNKFKQIRFTGVVWTCKINEIFSLPKTAIKGIKSTGQYEGVVTYVVGYRNASTYIGASSLSIGSMQRVTMKFKK